MHSKYLQAIGITDYLEEDNRENPHRKIISEEYERVYGVDPRECYDLESTTFEHLYVWLLQYKKDATGTINLHYHTIKVNGIVWYQDEIIDRCINSFKQYLIMFHSEKRIATLNWYLGDAVLEDAYECLSLFMKNLKYLWW